MEHHAEAASIVALTQAYCRAIDDRQFDSLRDVFSPDATVRVAEADAVDLDSFLARLPVALGRFERWEHHIADHEVVIDGDTATSRCSLRAIHVRPAGQRPPVYTLLGRYEDRLVRTPDGWRIAHRSLVATHREGRELDPQ